MKVSIRFLAAMAAAGILAAGAGVRAQSTSFDVEVALDDFGTFGYFVASYAPASANVAPTGSGNLNPTMNLEAGKRYRFTYANAGEHPFEILARGTDPGQDTVLLSLIGPGTLESDTGIDWHVQGNQFYFTLTPALAAAMQASGKTPGYRCNSHPFDMRGSFHLISSSVEDWPDYKAGAAPSSSDSAARTSR